VSNNDVWRLTVDQRTYGRINAGSSKGPTRQRARRQRQEISSSTSTARTQARSRLGT
jgi:hypothetical protein